MVVHQVVKVIAEQLLGEGRLIPFPFGSANVPGQSSFSLASEKAPRQRHTGLVGG